MPAKILSNVYRSTIESILTSSITVWYGNCTTQDRKALQRVIKSAQSISGAAFPLLQDTYNTRVIRRAHNIIKDRTHPQHHLFTLLPSDKLREDITTQALDTKRHMDRAVDHTHHVRRCSMKMPRSCDVKRYEDWYKVGTSCVMYFNETLNFTDAEFRCRKEAPGGHLASVHSRRANNDLNCIVFKYNKKSPRIWLGGFELFNSRKWVWIDDSNWDFQAWVPGEPNNHFNKEDCLEMNWKEKGKWNDDRCLKKKNFLCSFTY
ncbi:lectin-like [Chanos chanos]|uniref:Lectin-like n=1 Tax=Chanos chanos TaxID=29144 RepID=A0A6J2W3V9_CHACN|nr:lectin-like [Chanos chanos]